MDRPSPQMTPAPDPYGQPSTRTFAERIGAARAVEGFPAAPGLLGSRERAVAGAMAPQPEGGVEYEDFDGAGGWGYRRYSDGSIKIIKAPEGHKAGAKLSGGVAYDAITSEIASRPPVFQTPGLAQPGPDLSAARIPVGASPQMAPAADPYGQPSTRTFEERSGQAVAPDVAALSPEMATPGADLIRRLRGLG